MKRFLCFIIAGIICLFNADAAVRGTTVTNARQTLNSRTTNNSLVNRTPRVATTARSATTTARSAIATPRNTARSIGNAISRSGIARATANIATQTFDSGYNVCRDAYFTCMDQFCAVQNDTYRRCVCSSHLSEIQSREKSLAEASDSIATFKDLNIDIIPKTAAEVKAMLSASAGEQTQKYTKDLSDASKTLNGISSILSKAKSQSLSTQGTLDIGGDVNSIWANTYLASGANIANLSGEQLYNAVHAQCAEFVNDKCPSISVRNMVVSAYGMYIENDCALLASALSKKQNQTNSNIRATEREMDNARLDNYNAHNSTSINDCIANIRSDITSDSACGKDYVHCLDVSGLFLNRITGEPIYTSNFYQLETQISLANDILTNQTNRLLVAELNNKRKFAAKSLDTCRDLSNDIWDEFMRQAITEIYQAQQTRIRQVKEECLDVVNTCYDEQTNSLRDFSNIDKNLLIGSSLELAEEMCQEKLTTCSNLYGRGANGMQELLTAMHRITDQKIASSCLTNLRSYVNNMCAVPSTDTIHAYPYACRVYMPGDQRFARNSECNRLNPDNEAPQGGDTPGGDTPGGDTPGGGSDGSSCGKIYSSCFDGYYLSGDDCQPCPSECPTTCDTTTGQCPALPDEPTEPTDDSEDMCKDDGQYVGSLYQKLVRYALQVCIRQSQTGTEMEVPENILQDISTVMYSVITDMGKELAKECERLGGIWISTPALPTTASELKKFYDDTGSNKKWGYCIEPDTTSAGTEESTNE